MIGSRRLSDRQRTADRCGEWSDLLQGPTRPRVWGSDAVGGSGELGSDAERYFKLAIDTRRHGLNRNWSIVWRRARLLATRRLPQVAERVDHAVHPVLGAGERDPHALA